MQNLVFDKIRAKVTRANQHIQDFQLGLTAFHDTGPYAIAIKEDAQAGKRIYYICKADPVPDALATIASDVIQNLRDPLDHIAYQLVLDARSGTKPDWNVHFPISGSSAHYPATRGGQIKGVRQEVIDAIDATEPYKGGKGHALWQLSKLNNLGKHELLVGAGSFFGSVDVSVDAAKALSEAMGKDIKISPTFIRPADNLLPMKVGDELFIEPLNHKVAQDRQFTFDVSFNKPGVIEGEPAIKTLQDLSNLVGGIVESFESFFT